MASVGHSDEAMSRMSNSKKAGPCCARTRYYIQFSRGEWGTASYGRGLDVLEEQRVGEQTADL